MKNKVLKFFALFSVLALVLVLSPTLARTSECDDDSYEQTPSEDSSGGSNILLKYVRVTSPNGGEILGRNAEAAIVSVSDTHNVTWDSLSAGVKTVDILYSLDMGDTWHEIVMKHENTGAYNWKLPNINASPVLLRVVGYGEGSQVLGSDLSNSPFMIFNYIAEPEVVSENAAEY